MKILIVDDNVAIQEIIKDILVDEGHNVRVAGTAAEAVQKVSDFNPDVVVLDSKVGDDDGFHILSEISADRTPEELKVILLKGGTELAPTDNPYIKASMDKPFRSSDMIDALRTIQETDRTEETVSTEKARNKPKKGLFRRRSKDDVPMDGTLEEDGLTFGRSYVIFEQVPRGIYRFVNLFIQDKCNVLIVTAGKAKAVKERFSYDSIEVLSLSGRGKSGTMDIQELGTMTANIRHFIEGHERPVVIFDTFGEIIAVDGINMPFLMLQQLMSGKSRACTFGISVDPTVLTKKDMAILMHNTIEYKIQE